MTYEGRDPRGWHGSTGHPATTFLVHGEPERGMKAMAKLLAERGCNVAMPSPDASTALDTH